MMRWRCRGYRALAVDCAEGTLRGRQRARLERHLAQCPACADELEGLRHLPTALKTAPMPDPGEEFWRHQRQAIGRAIRNLPEPGTQREPAWQFAGLQRSAWRNPLAATVALLLAVLAYRMTERPPPPPAAEDAAAAVATLDPQSLVALREFMESLVPHDDSFASAAPDDETVLAALPVEDVIDAGVLPDAPQARDLSDEELDGLGALVGGIG